MKSELTKEEEELLEVYADKWINGSLKNPVVDKKAAIELVTFYYELVNLSCPKIIFTGSPVGNQIARNLIGHSMKEQKEITKKYFPAENICDLIEWDEKDAKLYKKFKEPNVKNKLTFYEPYSVLSNSGWMGFYDFFYRIGIVDCPKFIKLSQLAITSGVWEIIPFEEFCFVCGGPSSVLRNDEKQLHSDQAPAVEWPDGTCFYSLNGVSFDEDVWRKIVTKEFRIEDLQSLTNADQNAVAVGMLSPERLLEFTNAKFMNKGVKGTELYKVENFMGRGETEYAMVMTCQSTGRKFLEWAVDKEVAAKGDADEAHACSFIDADGNRLSLEDYLTMAES